MNRTNGNKTSKLLAMLLTLAMLLPLFTLPIAAEDSEPSSLLATDYSDPSSPVVVELGASEYVAMLLGTELCQAEAEYLDVMLGDDLFRYSNAIPAASIGAEYEGKVLRVRAQAYEYTAANGATVSWIPVQASINGESKKLTQDGNSYGATFSGMDSQQQSQLLVQYRCTLTVPSTTVDLHRNFAYLYARSLYDQQNANQQYYADLSAYNRYLDAKAQYERDVIAYDAYLIEKQTYDTKNEAYQAYLKEYEKYQSALAAYEAYLAAEEAYKKQLAAHEKYLEDIKTYDQRLKEYEVYHAQLQKAQDVLAVMDSIFVSNSEGKQLYATLMGGTVDQVLNRRDELTALGVPVALLDTAASSTAALRSLLSTYSGLSDPAEKLAYYKANYAEISSQMGKLYDALYTLFSDYPSVKWALDTLYDRLTRYMEFVSQLYVVSTGLNDGWARDSSWQIIGSPSTTEQFKFGYADMLESCQLPDDKNNADPSTLPDLPAAIAKPETPTPVDKPTIPTPVAKPVEPDVVKQPTAPAVVAKPVEPTPVQHPGEEPLMVEYTALQQSLIDAIKSGKLRSRPNGKAATMQLEQTLTRTVTPAQSSTVTFYDYDGKTVLAEYYLTRGEQIVYLEDAPVREATAKNTYTFTGWQTVGGQTVTSLGTADEANMHFYATYAATARKYTVTWVVDGVSTTTTVAYGGMPKYDGVPTKAADATYTYTFDSWSPMLIPVTQDVTYTANFRSTYQSCTVTWVLDGKEYQEQYRIGEVPFFKGSTDKKHDGTYTYTFRGWSPAIGALSGDVTYRGEYTVESIVPTEGDEAPLPIVDLQTAYRLTSEGDRVSVAKLLALAAENSRALELVLLGGDATLRLSEDLLDELRGMGCASIALELELQGASRARSVTDGADSLRVVCLNADGEALSPQTPVTLVTTLSGKATAATQLYTQDAQGSVTEVAATFDAASSQITTKVLCGTQLFFCDEYTLTIGEAQEGEISGVITLPDSRRGRVGEEISFTLRYEDGYRVELLTVTGEVSGQTIALTAAEDGVTYSFTMPAENVVIHSTLARQTYTVRFEVDGVEILATEYYKGDTVVLPENPVKVQDGDTVYTFDGWSPEVTTVTGDVTYVAKFTSATIGGEDPFLPGYKPGFNWILFIGISFVVLLTGGIVLIVLRRRAKAKAAKPDSDPDGTPDGDPSDTPDDTPDDEPIDGISDEMPEDEPTIADEPEGEQEPESEPEKEPEAEVEEEPEEPEEAVYTPEEPKATPEDEQKQERAPVAPKAPKEKKPNELAGKTKATFVAVGTAISQMWSSSTHDVDDLLDELAPMENEPASKAAKAPKAPKAPKKHVVTETHAPQERRRKEKTAHHPEEHRAFEEDDELDFTEFDAYEAERHAKMRQAREQRKQNGEKTSDEMDVDDVLYDFDE